MGLSHILKTYTEVPHVAFGLMDTYQHPSQRHSGSARAVHWLLYLSATQWIWSCPLVLLCTQRLCTPHLFSLLQSVVDRDWLNSTSKVMLKSRPPALLQRCLNAATAHCAGYTGHVCILRLYTTRRPHTKQRIMSADVLQGMFRTARSSNLTQYNVHNIPP